MRILVVAPGPGFSVADVQHGWERALAAQGHEVRTYNLNDRIPFFGGARWPNDDGDLDVKLDTEQIIRLAVEPLASACYRFWPDVILVVSGFFIPDDLWHLWRQRQHRTILLCTESPYEDDRQLAQVMEWQPTHVLLNDPTNLMAFKDQHPSVWYAPHAYDPVVHHPSGVPHWKNDFAFVGTGYPSRVDFLSRVDWRGLDPVLAGMWSNLEGTCLEHFVTEHPIDGCFDNALAADLYRQTKVSANLYRGGNVVEAGHESLRHGWAMGPREIELAACETFFLREPRAEGDELLHMLPTFTEPGDFGDKLRYYLAHDSVRQRLAEAAREAVTDRTFDANARHLMQLLGA